ncbi:MAG: hypothetical protein NVS3B12_26630 [Acidimicrobiales bacterium]
MDDHLLAEARSTAAAQGTTLSAWLADAALDRLRLTALRELVDDWEAEHGVVTTAELDALEGKVTEARRRARTRRPGDRGVSHDSRPPKGRRATS